MTVRIIVGDCRDALAQLPDESVHCVVTSPPYWGLRTYGGDAGMIGLEPTFDAHVDNILAVFREVWRVLRPEGTLWMNYGDSYAATGAPGGGSPDGARRGRKDNASARAASLPNTARASGLKPKDLMMMPSRIAAAMQLDGVPRRSELRAIERAQRRLANRAYAAGEDMPPWAEKALASIEAEYAEAKGKSWWIRSEIIWHKPNPVPQSAPDRPTVAHEKMYLMAKSPRYFYDRMAVRTASDREVWAGVGMAPDRNDHNAQTEPRPGSGYANLRNVWSIPTASFDGNHYATFPTGVVEPCILAGTSARGRCSRCGAPHERIVEKGELREHPKRPSRKRVKGDFDIEADEYRPAGVSGHLGMERDWITAGWTATCECDADVAPCVVLDPFAGVGTVGMVAARLQRDATLIEINGDYAEIAQKRLKADGGLFASVEIAK